MKIICVFLSILAAASALPNGAPICEVGDSNVRNAHLRASRNPQSGTIEFGGYQAILNGVPLLLTPANDPAFVNEFQFGTDLLLTIVANSTNYLRGVLLVASGGDRDNVDSLDTRTPGALIPGPNTKESIGCENFAVSSVVHEENSQKGNLTATFRWPTDGQVLYLDVNIVRNNNDADGSQYYFSQYVMKATTIEPPGRCGLLNLGLFCPGTRCGLFGRLLGLCQES